MAHRAHLWTLCGTEVTGQLDRYYPTVYYGSLSRLDELLPGVGLALLRHGSPGAWVTRRAHGVTVAGVAAVALLWSGFATAGWGTTATFVVTTVLSLGVGAALHRAVEQPFLRLRDRVLPTNTVPTRATRRRCR
jgi:peptidoglycan/LPS O-acetylase OafA/YrhL